METYTETLDPSELKDFTFDWTPQLSVGETVVSQVFAFVEAAGATSPSDTVASPYSRVWLTGGTPGQTIIYTLRATTSGSRTLEAALGVKVADTVTGPFESNVERLTRYVSEAQTALHQLATGTQIVDLWHDGRRRRYAQQDVSDLQNYLDWLNRQLEAATATENGKPRRRAIGLAWRN